MSFVLHVNYRPYKFVAWVAFAERVRASTAAARRDRNRRRVRAEEDKYRA